MSHDFAKKGDAKGTGKVSVKKSSAKKPVKKAVKKAGKIVPKKSSAIKSQAEKKAAPAWLWFLSGVIATISVQVFYHLSLVDTSQVTTVQDGPTEVQADALDDEIDKYSHRPEFRFYDELKHREVEVSGNSVAEREQEDYNYALQAGSFKQSTDAESLRAEVILLGLDAEVERRKNDSGTVWHRVIVGPFTSRSKLSKARGILIDNNIKSIRIKRG